MKKLQTIKTKMIAAALVFALVLSSIAMAAPTTNVSADEKDDNQPWFNTEDGAKDAENAASLVAALIEGDDSLRGLIKISEAAVELMSKRLPAVGTFATPFLKMLLALYSDQEPEKTLDDISKQMELLSRDLDNAKSEIILAMSSANDMTEFVNTFNAFNNSFNEMNHQISHISGFQDYTRQDKEKRLAELVGPRKTWTLTDNVVAKLDALGNYLCGETKLTSNNKDIYAVVMDHYSKTVCFAREAMDQTDRFVTDALAVYLEGTSQLINCILAERSYLLKLGTLDDVCDAEYCANKVKMILAQVDKVGKCVTNYFENTSPVTFYDRSNGAQKNIDMQYFVGGTGFGAKMKLDEILPAGKTLNNTQMNYIVDYVKSHYPGKSLQEFLDYVGFRFTDRSYEDWVRTCKEEEPMYRQYQNNSNISQEMKTCLELYLNPTLENYRKAGLMNIKDAFIMIDKGYDRTFPNSMGYTSTYYYKGIKLVDTLLNIQDKAYYYESNGSNKENRADANMYYLICK